MTNKELAEKIRAGLKHRDSFELSAFDRLLYSHAAEIATALERLDEAEELLKDAQCELGTSNFTTAKVAADAIATYFARKERQ